MEVIGEDELIRVIKRYHNLTKTSYADSVNHCLHNVRYSNEKLQFLDGTGNVVNEVDFKNGVGADEIATALEVNEMLDEILGLDNGRAEGVNNNGDVN